MDQELFKQLQGEIYKLMEQIVKDNPALSETEKASKLAKIKRAQITSESAIEIAELINKKGFAGIEEGMDNYLHRIRGMKRELLFRSGGFYSPEKQN